MLRFGVFLPTALCLVVAAVIALSAYFGQQWFCRSMRISLSFFASQDFGNGVVVVEETFWNAALLFKQKPHMFSALEKIFSPVIRFLKSSK